MVATRRTVPIETAQREERVPARGTAERIPQPPEPEAIWPPAPAVVKEDQPSGWVADETQAPQVRFASDVECPESAPHDNAAAMASDEAGDVGDAAEVAPEAAEIRLCATTHEEIVATGADVPAVVVAAEAPNAVKLASGVRDELHGICQSLFPPGGRGRSIGFAGMEPGVGASEVAAAVAMTLASGDDRRRVALIELHPARRGIAAKLHLRTGPGLAGVLAGECDLPNALATLQFAGGALDVLVAGEAGASAPDAARLAPVVAELSLRYECVVVDAPSIERLREWAPLAARLDGCVLIVPGGTDGPPRAQAAVRRLRASGATVLGLVQNVYRARSPEE